MRIDHLFTPLQPGDRAPDFELPAVNHDGSVSLSDYRGQHALLVALFRGLYCPFCRRAIAQLGAINEQLEELGVRSVGVVATAADNARLYYRYRPTKVLLVADPEASTHRSFGIPRAEKTPELLQALEEVRVDPLGTGPVPIPVASAEVTKADGYEANSTDHEDWERQFPQLTGEFLIDREGVVRWANVECYEEGLTGLGKFPTHDTLLATAKDLDLV